MFLVAISAYALAIACLVAYWVLERRRIRRSRNRRVNHTIFLPPRVRTWPDVQ